MVIRKIVNRNPQAIGELSKLLEAKERNPEGYPEQEWTPFFEKQLETCMVGLEMLKNLSHHNAEHRKFHDEIVQVIPKLLKALPHHANNDKILNTLAKECPPFKNSLWQRIKDWF